MSKWQTEKHDGYERDVRIETPEEIEERRKAEERAKFDPASVTALGQALVQQKIENTRLKQALAALGKEVVALKLRGGIVK